MNGLPRNSNSAKLKILTLLVVLSLLASVSVFVGPAYGTTKSENTVTVDFVSEQTIQSGYIQIEVPSYQGAQIDYWYTKERRRITGSVSEPVSFTFLEPRDGYKVSFVLDDETKFYLSRVNPSAWINEDRGNIFSGSQVFSNLQFPEMFAIDGKVHLVSNESGATFHLVGELSSQRTPLVNGDNSFRLSAGVGNGPWYVAVSNTYQVQTHFWNRELNTWVADKANATLLHETTSGISLPQFEVFEISGTLFEPLVNEELTLEQKGLDGEWFVVDALGGTFVERSETAINFATLDGAATSRICYQLPNQAGFTYLFSDEWADKTKKCYDHSKQLFSDVGDFGQQFSGSRAFGVLLPPSHTSFIGKMNYSGALYLQQMVQPTSASSEPVWTDSSSIHVRVDGERAFNFKVANGHFPLRLVFVPTNTQTPLFWDSHQQKFTPEESRATWWLKATQSLRDPEVKQTSSSAPVLRIEGDVALDEELRVAVPEGSELSGVTVQWYRGDFPIFGATNLAYTLTDADELNQVHAEVRLQRSGYTDTFVTSKVYLPKSTHISSEPLIDGAVRYGNILRSIAGEWGTDAIVATKWFVDGVERAGTEGASYRISASDVGKCIQSVVVGSFPDGKIVERKSKPQIVLPAEFENLHHPRLPSTVHHGAELISTGGFWPETSTATYRWLLNGVTIAGDHQPSLRVDNDGFSAEYILEVTVRQDGYATTVLTSNASILVPREFSSNSQVILPSSAPVGELIYVKTSGWDSDVTFNYRWFRNGIPVLGVNGNTYIPSPGDLNSEMYVDVTSSKPGYESITVKSNATLVVLGKLKIAPRPRILGVPSVGNALTADPGTWDKGAQLSFQWMRNGIAIKNANHAKYSLAPADVNQNISVSAIGSKEGFRTQKVLSAAQKIGKGKLKPQSRPTVKGTIRVGQKVKASTGTYETGVRISYVWKANGKLIPNEKSSALTLDATRLGQRISVEVVAAKAGYHSISSSSKSTSKVQRGKLKRTPKPKITGKAEFGKKLRVSTGTWTKGVALSYQWYSNGKAIKNAKKSTYRVERKNVGKRISVRVTGKKKGYSTVSRVSDRTKKVRE